jgi:hypothetical protein
MDSIVNKVDRPVNNQKKTWVEPMFEYLGLESGTVTAWAEGFRDGTQSGNSSN